MARGIVDVLVSRDLDDNTVVMVTECLNGYPHDLNQIRHGMSVQLKNGSSERKVRIRRETGDECDFHYMEVSEKTAEALGLRSGRRYLLDYDAYEGTLAFTRITTSRIQSPLLVERSRTNELRITIGYASYSMLGMKGLASSRLTVKTRRGTATLRVTVTENELDEDIVFSSAAAARLGILTDTEYLLEYSQKNKVLTLHSAVSSSEENAAESASQGSRSSSGSRSSTASSSGSSGSRQQRSSREAAAAAANRTRNGRTAGRAAGASRPAAAAARPARAKTRAAAPAGRKAAAPGAAASARRSRRASTVWLGGRLARRT